MHKALIICTLLLVTIFHEPVGGESKTMLLRVISNYGEIEKVVTQAATPEIVKATMRSIDWNGFHQVVLELPNGDWMEVGGSLDPSDGLSVMYQESGVQHVIKYPPTTVQQMTQFLLSYLSGGQNWKEAVKWE
jgi:hypothetical protein